MDVGRALGDLEGTVRAMADQWRRQEEAATTGRRVLYERFEGLSSQLAHVLAKVDGMTQDVAELKNDLDNKVMPTIESVKASASHKDGFISASKLFWAAIVALAGAVGFAIHEAVLYFKHGPPPGH